MICHECGVKLATRMGECSNTSKCKCPYCGKVKSCSPDKYYIFNQLETSAKLKDIIFLKSNINGGFTRIKDKYNQ